MQGRLAQFLPRLLRFLPNKMPLERDCLVKMKCFEILIAGVDFKSIEGLCSCIDCLLAVPLGFLQKGVISAFDPFIFCIVFFYGLLPLFEVIVHGGFTSLDYVFHALRKTDVHFFVKQLQPS